MTFLNFEELAGSPTLDIAVDRSRGTRTAKIRWQDITALRDYLFISNFSFSKEMPTFTFLRARSMHVEPWLKDKDKIGYPDSSGDSSLNDYDLLNTYGYAEVRIEYETPRWQPDQGNDPTKLLTHRWAAGGQFMTVDSAGLAWGDGAPLGVDEAWAGFVIPTIEHMITWEQVRKPPFSTIRSLIGSVNSGSLEFTTGVIPPETLLFMGGELQRDVLSDGAAGWRVQYRFSERPVPLPGKAKSTSLTDDVTYQAYSDTIGGVSTADAIAVGGWNHFFRPTSRYRATGYKSKETPAGFYRIGFPSFEEGVDDVPIYRLGNHAALFQEAS